MARIYASPAPSANKLRKPIKETKEGSIDPSEESTEQTDGKRAKGKAKQTKED